jgi:hypothetical protein
MKETLANMAKTKGFMPKSEVTTGQGRIDLIWQDLKGKPVAGFEIDVFSPRSKSLAKLRALDCPYKFVILRSNPEPLHWEQDILLIGLSKEGQEYIPSLPITEEDTDKEGEGECNDQKVVTKSLHTSQKEGISSLGVTKRSLQDKIKSQEKEIFSHWNSQKIIIHKVLSPKMEGSIKSVLKTYNQEEICQAMTNYSDIVHGAEYRWTYKWTLEDFLHRGLEKFMDGEVARSNYRIEIGGAHGKGEVRPDSHRGSAQAPTRAQYLSSIRKS